MVFDLNRSRLVIRYNQQIRDILTSYQGAFDVDTTGSCVWGIVTCAYLEKGFPTMLSFIPTILSEFKKPEVYNG